MFSSIAGDHYYYLGKYRNVFIKREIFCQNLKTVYIRVVKIAGDRESTQGRALTGR